MINPGHNRFICLLQLRERTHNFILSYFPPVGTILVYLYRISKQNTRTGIVPILSTILHNLKLAFTIHRGPQVHTVGVVQVAGL